MFLILIAVALFAALAYVVSQSSRSGSQGPSSEKAALTAAAIMNFASTLTNGVMRMSITGGCSPEDISFESAQIVTSYAHAPPARTACKLFDPDGGAVTYQEVSTWFDPAFYTTGYPFFAVGDTSIFGAGTEEADLILTLPWIPADVCHAINKKVLGAGYDNTLPVLAPASVQSEFKGTYGVAGNYIVQTSVQLSGDSMGCAYDAVYGYNVFYNLILQR